MRTTAAFRNIARFLTSVIVVPGFCLAACVRAVASDDIGPETIELDMPVFSGAYGTDFFAETARQFETLHAGVRVNIYGNPRIQHQLRIRMIDGSYPDATFAELAWLNLIRAGKLVDLTPYLDGPSWDDPQVRWRDTFQPGLFEPWTIDGGVYGLPVVQSCWTLFYNRRLFREHGWSVPRTWDEFFALGDAMKTAGIAPVAVPGVYLRYADTFLRAAFYNLVGANGWRAYNELAPGARTDPRFVRAAATFQRLAQGYLAPGWQGMTHTAAQLAFLRGEAATVVSGSWMLHEMQDSIPADFELGAANFPVFAEGVTDPSTVQSSSEYFFLFARGDPRRVQRVVDYLRFLTSRERMTAFVRAKDAPVAVRGVPAELFSPRMQETVHLLARARESFSAPPNMLQPPGMNQALTDARYALATGAITPEEFGARLEAAAAASRERLASPHRVHVRHPWLGSTLVLGLTLVFAWTGWGVYRRLKVGRPGSGNRSPDAGLGEAGPGAATPAKTAVEEIRPTAETPAAWFGPLRARLGATFVAPAFLLFAAILLVPGLGSFVWSFSDWDALNPREWVGLFNFRWLLFESDVFWRALGNNLFLMFVPAAVVVPLALFFAALIQRGVAGAKLFRACVLFPNILGGVAASLIWLYAYDPASGFINSTLTEMGQWIQALTGDWWLPQWLLGFGSHAWLAQGWPLYGAMIPIYVWLMTGFNLVLYLAAIQGIDPQYYEAAELDGADAWAQFWKITLLMIREVVAISVVFIVIGGVNTFEMVWLLTAQDPSSGSHVLGTWMVSTMFNDSAIGRATAIAVVMFVLVLAGSAVTLLTSRRESVEA